MGLRIAETHYDDLDESTEGVRTVLIALDEQQVEIDLSEKNFAKLSAALSPYLEAGRRASTVGTKRRRRAPESAKTPARTSTKTSNTQLIREWAQANGHEVNSRGRISKDIVDAYEAAHRA